MDSRTQRDRLIRFAQRYGLIRSRDLTAIKVSRAALQRAVERGEMVRQARGVYSLADHEPTRHLDLATVCARAPHATICLLSALGFHELTSQIPRSVWVMIDRTAHRPRMHHPHTRIVRASGDALNAGVEVHRIEGVRVRMTNPAKTVADCFKYRRHVGLDVAIEALRDCLGRRKATPAEIHAMAQVNGVAGVMRPFLEALA